MIDPACKLQGGFAFYLWFGSNEHAGDFVISLGGYNPHFTPPPWYPTLPRLGFNWPMSSEIDLRGDAYFALTPSCVMGGGALSLTFDSGDLHAWFDAYADFIIFWKPFYFDVDIGVSIGASYTLDLLFTHATVTVELSASVELWGPPLAGVAHVSWWVISFSIDINGGGSPSFPGATVHDWATFESTFLPKPAPAAALTAAVEPQTAICRPRAASGLTGTFQRADGTTVWQVAAATFALSTETVIPATTTLVGGPTTRSFDGPAVGVYPMGSMTIGSTHTLSATGPDGEPYDLTKWMTWVPLAGNAPGALWGTTNTGAPPLSAGVVPGLMGLAGTPVAPTITGPDAFPLSALAFDDLPKRCLPLPTTPPVDGSSKSEGDPLQTIAATLANPTVAATREAIVAALNAAVIGVELVGGELTVMAEDAPGTFAAEPMLGPVGSTGPPTVSTAAPPVRVAAPRVPASEPARSPAELHAVFRSHAAGQRHWATAHVADRVLHPDRRRALDAVQRYPRGAAGAAELAPGTTVVWRLGPAADLGLATNGALPLRLTLLDAQAMLLDDVLLPAGTAVEHALPWETDLVAVTCLSDAPPAAAAGWRGTSTLLQLAPQAFLADGAVVRPQSPIRLRRGRGTTGTGTTTGNVLVARNLGEDERGETRPGWTETQLPGWAKTLAVPLVRAEDGADEAVAVSIVGAGGLQKLGPQNAIEIGDIPFMLFDCATPSEPARLAVHVRLGDAWRSDGVIGLAAGVELESATLGPVAASLLRDTRTATVALR